MKLFRYVFPVFAAVLFSSACTKDETGKGDATVAFEKDSYTFQENSGMVNIPLKFTGEPARYPIVLNISATVDGNASLGDVAHFPQQIGSLRYGGKADLSVEIELKDNFTSNGDVHLTLEIISADGAEIIGGKTVITIEDNDGTFYESLYGIWNFAANLDGKPVTFEVGIDAGETEAEQQENIADGILRVLGFAGYHYTDDGVPFQWYLQLVQDAETEEYSLKTIHRGSLIAGPGTILDDEQFQDVPYIRIEMYSFPAYEPNLVYPSMDITATISDDIRTITFDPEWVMYPVLFTDETSINDWQDAWGNFYNVKLER